MNYRCTLIADTCSDELTKIAAKESGKKDRSELSIKKQEQKTIFQINSKDSIALKASFNTVIKILSVYEKTKNLVENE